jgi:hypothetical protein
MFVQYLLLYVEYHVVYVQYHAFSVQFRVRPLRHYVVLRSKYRMSVADRSIRDPIVENPPLILSIGVELSQKRSPIQGDPSVNIFQGLRWFIFIVRALEGYGRETL